MSDGEAKGEVSAPRHLFQTELWSRFKAEFGWSTTTLSPAPDASDPAIRAMFRRVGPFPFGYVPYPPLGAPISHRSLRRIAERLAPSAPSTPCCIRFDLYAGPPVAETAAGSRVAPAPVDVQPRHTTVIDLRPDEELLASMHKKHRYNIRLAERRGVQVRDGGVAALAEWYRLYRQTAARDRIAIHSEHYYRRLFELAHDYPEIDLRLYLATHDTTVLSGIVVAHHHGEATYLYGASGDEGRNLMPNYAVQWHAMRAARDAGCATYDLFGIPPTDRSDHHLSGLYRFKVGFGGRILDRGGCWDVILRPMAYRLYRLAERVRGFYHHSWRKRRGR